MALAQRSESGYNLTMKTGHNDHRPVFPAAPRRAAERGSALWFILIAIVLIGLLTVMLSRSSTNVDQSGDVETIRIKISQMLRFTKGVQSAVETMTMNGISESDLSFAIDGSDNTNCGTDTDCRVFHANGGGLNRQNPPTGAGATAWLVVGTNNVRNIGTAAPDLILVLRNVPAAYCTQINRILSFATPADDADVDFTAFAGSFPAAATQTLDEANGANAACLVTGTENFFYQVLLAR